MVTIQSLLLSALLATPSDTVLLDFTSDGCVYCVQMEPTIRRLEADGMPVRRINISRNPAWRDHYQIEGVPTYVMLANGREVGRIVGRTSYDELTRLYEKAGVRPAGRQQSPSATPKRQNNFNEPPTRLASSNRSQSLRNQAADSMSQLDAERAALDATVRIGVEDARFRDFASGTIIDVHGDEALVLTCGHVFRDTQGKGRVTVDFFADGKARTVPGKLIDYVADRGDVGLVVVRTPFPVKPIQVAPPSYRPQQGDRAFTVGCDGGKQPSLRHSQISYVNRYNGSPPNIEAAGVPVKGRSGGGLFTADGMLIGVCNAADEQLREGVYAAAAQIHEQLKRLGLEQLYLRGDSQVASRSASVQPAARTPGGEFALPDRHPASLQTTEAAGEDVEVICIIRPKTNPGASRTIVLDNPPSGLLSDLRHEFQRQQANQVASSRQPMATTSTGQPRYNSRHDAHVVRAQSE